MGSSPKKVVDEIGVDLSKIKWPDTQISRFNVTHITELDNFPIISQKSETFHPYVLDYHYS